MHSVLEVISLMQDLMKYDRLGKNCNGSDACLVTLLKMIKIGLVTCLTSVVDRS